VAEIAAVAHGVGALTYVDGVHATAHRPIDVAALGADFYVTSAYKWSGPHYAAVVAAPARWETLEPVKLVPSPTRVPDRFEYGTLSFELLAGLTAAVDHLAGIAEAETVTGGMVTGGMVTGGIAAAGIAPGGTALARSGAAGAAPAGIETGGTAPAEIADARIAASRVVAGGASGRRARLVASMTAVEAYENGLAAKLAAGLAGIGTVTVLPAPADRCPTIAFRVTGQTPAETARRLGDEGICVSHGDYYAVEFFTAAGLRASGGAVRASIYHYNTAGEIDRLLDALRKM
jgi:selenocysteine lyase/cysteine desulfurase